MTAGQAPGYCLSSTMRKAHVNSVMILLPLLQLAESRVPLGDRLVALATCQARRMTATASGTETADLPYSSPSYAFRTARSARSSMTGHGELPRGARRHGAVYPRRRLAAGIRSGMLQPLQPPRPADGQHGPDLAAARPESLGILDLAASHAGIDVGR